MTFSLSHADPDPAFHPTAKTRMGYVFVILLSISAGLPMSLAVAICPTDIKKKNVGINAVSKWTIRV